jgi:hypothetical protein
VKNVAFYRVHADFVVALADLSLKDLFVSTSKSARTIDAHSTRTRRVSHAWKRANVR